MKKSIILFLSFSLLFFLFGSLTTAYAQNIDDLICDDSDYCETFTFDPPAPEPFVSGPFNNRYFNVAFSSDWLTGAGNAVYYDDQFQNPSLSPFRKGQHTEDCGPPTDFTYTHPYEKVQDFSFRCKFHMMTSVEGERFGSLTVTPNYMVDLSQGEAKIAFDVSTKTGPEDGNDGYNWWAISITPFEDNYVHPEFEGLGSFPGHPDNAVAVVFAPNGLHRFHGTQVVDGVQSGLGFKGRTANSFEYLRPYGAGENKPLALSYRRREHFEIILDQDKLSFCLEDYDTDGDGVGDGWEFCWAEELPLQHLDWTKGVVQISTHAFDSEHPCPHPNGEKDPTDECGINTFHWDNLQIHPATPFTMIEAAPPPQGGNGNPNYPQMYVDEYDGHSSTINFAQPAPDNAYVRFNGYGSNVRLSYDGGSTWTDPVQSQQEKRGAGFDSRKLNSYFIPIPAGVQSVTVDAEDWENFWYSHWHMRDFSIWSTGEPIPTSPTPTATPGVVGDINHDGVVNVQDFILLSNAFGTADPDADLNSDGTVNVQDFIILSNAFGS